MTAADEATPKIATPNVAAGALFFDHAGRVLLVRPTYKDHWDLLGGYVEPGESPRAACLREITEEIGLTLPVGDLLVVDWAPADKEGDKMLFVFDGGNLAEEDQARITFPDGELAEWRFLALDELEQFTVPRLTRRVRTAVAAKHRGQAVYAEHGIEPTG